MRAATDLVRVAARGDGSLTVGRHEPGRGAWLCPDDACITRAERRKAIGRALRAPVAPDALAGLRDAIRSGSGTLDRPPGGPTVR